MGSANTSWQAVLDPGDADDFFAAPARPPRAPVDGDWHDGTAWWCSEVARTIYRRDDRPGFFAAAGLRELRFFDDGGTQAALVQAPDVAWLVFRGTASLRDWWTNVQTAPVAWRQGGAVHRGFARGLERVWSDVTAALAPVATPVIATGHSLGGALATLAASRRAFACTYTFGAPRVGDEAFTRTLRGPLHRVVLGRDAVPRMPPRRLGFAHAGQRRHLSTPGAVDEGSDRDGSADVTAAGRSLRGRRWYDPHPSLCDHAPRNYSRALLAAANGARP